MKCFILFVVWCVNIDFILGFGVEVIYEFVSLVVLSLFFRVSLSRVIMVMLLLDFVLRVCLFLRWEKSFCILVMSLLMKVFGFGLVLFMIVFKR